MTTENFTKIDMGIDRTKEEWKSLLDSVKVNMNNVLTKEEQAFYVEEITYRITGARYSKKEVIKGIEESAADISDIGGF